MGPYQLAWGGFGTGVGLVFLDLKTADDTMHVQICIRDMVFDL